MQPFQILTSDKVQSPERLFTVIYGQPGVGKTSLTFTMPGPIFLLDFDHGVHRALQAPGHFTVQVNSYKEFRQWVFSPAFTEFVQENKIKTTALDTVGTLLDDFIAPYLCELNPRNGTGGALTLQGWGALSIEFGALKARLLSAGTELIAITHEKEEGEGDGKQVRLAVRGGSADIIYRSCDLLGYLYMRGNRRVLDFNPTQLHVGKNVAGLPALEIPDESEPSFSSFMRDKVIGAAMKQIAARNSRRLEMEGLLSGYISEIATLNTPDDFQAFSDKMKREQSATVVAHVKQAFSKRMTQAGVKINHDTKTFELVALPPPVIPEGLAHQQAVKKAVDGTFPETLTELLEEDPTSPKGHKRGSTGKEDILTEPV